MDGFNVTSQNINNYATVDFLLIIYDLQNIPRAAYRVRYRASVAYILLFSCCSAVPMLAFVCVCLCLLQK